MEVDIDIFDSVDHSDRGPTPSTSALPYFDPRPTQVEESQMVAVTDKVSLDLLLSVPMC